jgi:signal transduction histidine kinase
VTAALVTFAVLFSRETLSFREAVVAWAARDLKTRATQAAVTLRDALETGDLQRIHRFGADCRSDGVQLTVFTPPGGLYFDSLPAGTPPSPSRYVSVPCGEYTVRLGLPLARILAPFERAKSVLALAALLGGAVVLLVFYLTYRQRVRIAELKRLETFRREFIADVSHEIKTPLTGILGAVDLLTDASEPPPETCRTLLALVKKEARRLNALAQNILALARLERVDDLSGLSRAPVSLDQLLADVCARGRLKAPPGTVLELDAPARLIVTCDAQLVEQAAANLVENALRHAGADRVHVTLAPRGKGACVTVADDGIGIPPDKAAHIFERFYRVDPARSAATGGAGLGLAIARRIARLHGGDVVYESVSPHGSRFVLTLAGT